VIATSLCQSAGRYPPPHGIWKTHLAADRTSCTKATANQLRLFLHAGAYWLMWGLRMSMPKRSMWRVAQFDTLRLRLLKLAARVVEMKTQEGIEVGCRNAFLASDIMHGQLGVLDQAHLDVVAQARIGGRLVIGILDQHAHFATDALQAYRHRQPQEPQDIAGCIRRCLMLHRQINRSGQQLGQPTEREA
jgi:hypothetical protein